MKTLGYTLLLYVGTTLGAFVVLSAFGVDFEYDNASSFTLFLVGGVPALFFLSFRLDNDKR